MDLAKKRCVPCEGGTPPLDREAVANLLEQVPGWTVEGTTITRAWQLKNFAEVLAATNKVGALAEAEAHHPDIHLTAYKHLRVDLSTHAIGGLSENDFILAAKINEALV